MMTIAQFKAIRKALCLTHEGLGKRLGTEERQYTGRAVLAWETGQNDIPIAVEVLMKQMAE